ncbi:hypothetical protein V501_10554 [Pseudogymnoascus sp. VKM F-4519 (FW-2642)]|nr:hypothetical protein V501_10554 [Pseudogymnoascus sp. VKM F-4519 (FW-2642)]
MTPPSTSTSSSAMHPSPSLKTAKSALRKVIKARLSTLQTSSIEEQSTAVSNAIISWPKYQAAKSISVYLSMPSAELSTAAIVRDALVKGKKVFVPYLHLATERDRGQDGYLPKRCMDMVRLHGLEDFEGLENDSWGIPTVADEGVEKRERVLGGEREGQLDLMLLPGVAFQPINGGNEDGMVRRLGHGMGFYDFFIRRYRAKTKEVAGEEPLLVALALKEQVLENGDAEVPLGEHDAMLDGLVIGDGRILGKA